MLTSVTTRINLRDGWLRSIHTRGLSQDKRRDTLQARTQLVPNYSPCTATSASPSARCQQIVKLQILLTNSHVVDDQLIVDKLTAPAHAQPDTLRRYTVERRD